MNLLTLFWAFFKVGLFTLGGGYASLPLIQDAVVDTGYLTYAEFMDIVAISEFSPGPIALNAATFVGTKLLGFTGALTATFGFIAPAFIIVLILAVIYYKYRNLRVVDNVLKMLRPAVTAFIASAGITIAIHALTKKDEYILTFFGIDFFAIIGIAVCLAIMRIKRLNINHIYIMLGAGVFGGLYYYFAL